MALTSVSLIESDLGLSNTVATQVAESCLEAGLYLIRLKGQDWYDERLAWLALGGAATSDQQALLRLASRAESCLALYYALPTLNLKVNDDGGVTVIEWETDGSGTRRQTAFASGRSLLATQQELLRRAHLLVSGDVRLGYASDSTYVTSAQSQEVTLVEGESSSFVMSSVEDEYD